MVAAFPLHQAGRRAPAADPVAEAASATQAASPAEAAEATEEVIGPQSPAAWSEPAPAASTSAGAGQQQ